MKDAFHKGLPVADIIIIGAGVCGLSAAQELIDLADRQKRDRPRILILESENVPGGRVKSVTKENGATVNLGAHWFHGGDANPFYRRVTKRYPDLQFTLDTVQNLRGVFNNASVGPEFRARNEEALVAAWKEFAAREPESDISLGALAAQIGTDEARTYARFMAQLWLAVDDPAQVSAREFFADPFGPGGMQLSGGNGSLIARMVDDLSKAGVTILTDAPVRAVIETEDTVRVFLGDGRRFAAEQTISTVSVDVLKNGRITFSQPQPPELAAFLAGVGMGTMTKICVPLREEFFIQNGIAPDTHIDIVGPDSAVFCHARSGGAPVITVFTGGAAAREAETMTATQILEFLECTLAQVPGLENWREFAAGQPEATKWNTNPSYGGVYSARRIGGPARPDPVRAGRIIFAGEAFVADPAMGPGTMPGAWHSGRIAAAMALDALPAPSPHEAPEQAARTHRPAVKTY